MHVQPLESLDQWDDAVRDRYDPNKKKEEFRVYDDKTPPVVREFYRQNHQFQTLASVLEREKQFGSLTRGEMGIWEAMEKLNTLVDDSDPDIDLTQIEHAMQTAEDKMGRPFDKSTANATSRELVWKGPLGARLTVTVETATNHVSFVEVR